MPPWSSTATSWAFRSCTIRRLEATAVCTVDYPARHGPGLWLMPATTARERELIGCQCGGQPLLVLYTDDVQQIGNHLRAHGVRVWDEREDADSRSLHFEDLYGNVMVAAQLPIR